MEFENQCNRIYNQLDFEKQRDTESKCQWKFIFQGFVFVCGKKLM